MKILILGFLSLLGVSYLFGGLFYGIPTLYTKEAQDILTTMSNSGSFLLGSSGSLEVNTKKNDFKIPKLQFLTASHWIYFMNEKNITLSPGVLKLQEGGLFVADFSNNTEYKYTLPHARIQVLRPGFFTLEVSKNSFYIRSISALLQVKLTDSKGTQVSTVDIFPNIVAKIDNVTIDGLKNADTLRVVSVNTFQYQHHSILQNDFEYFSEEAQLQKFIPRILAHLQLYLQAKSKEFVQYSQGITQFMRKKEMQDRFLLWNPQRIQEAKIGGFLNQLQESLKQKRVTINEEQDMSEEQRKILNYFAFLEQIGSILTEIKTLDTPDIGALYGYIARKDEQKAYQIYGTIFDISYLQGTNPRDLSRYINMFYYSDPAIFLTNGKLSKGASLFISLYLSKQKDSDLLAKNALFDLYTLISKRTLSELKTDLDRSSALSNLFYNYYGILKALNRDMTELFFSRSSTTQDLELLPGANISFMKQVSAPWGNHIRNLQNQFILYKEEYLKYAPSFTQSQSEVAVLLEEEIARGKEIQDALGDYAQYKGNQTLDESAREEKGIILSNINTLPDEETTKKFFLNFRDVVEGSFNYQKEITAVRIQFTFGGVQFTGKIVDNSFTTEDVILVRNGIKDISKQFLRINLKNQFEKSNTAKNLLYQLYLDEGIIEKTDPSPTVDQGTQKNTRGKSTTPVELAGFVQSELLEKDFLNIQKDFPITYDSIDAKAEEGTYSIQLRDIFISPNNGITLTCQGSYIFQRHSFYKATCRSKNLMIEFTPSRIDLETFKAGIPSFRSGLGNAMASASGSMTLKFNFADRTFSAP